MARHRISAALLALLPLLAPGSQGAAAPAPALAVLEGAIEDGQGRPLATVEVVVRGPQLAAPRQVTSDEAGRFRLYHLPPGRFAVSFELPGHQYVEYEELRLDPAAIISLRVVMKAVRGDEEVLLSGGPAVEARRTFAVQAFSAAELAELPGSALRWLGAGVRARPRAPVEAEAGEIEGAPRSDTAPRLAESRIGMEEALGGVRIERRGIHPQLELTPVRGGKEHAGRLALNLSSRDLGSGAAEPAARGGQWWPDERRLGMLSIAGPASATARYALVLSSGRTREELSTRQLDPARSEQADALFGTFSWQAAANTLLESRLTLWSEKVDGDLPDPDFVDPGSARFSSSEAEQGLDLSWSVQSGPRIATWAALGGGTRSLELRPEHQGALLQDLRRDPEVETGGRYSGAAGFRDYELERRRTRLAGGLWWHARPQHRLGISAELDRRREDRHLLGSFAAAPSRCLAGDPAGMLVYSAGSGGWVPLAPDCDSDGDQVLDGLELAAAAGERWQITDEGSRLLRWHGAEGRRARQEELRIRFSERWTPRPDLSLEAGLELFDWRFTGPAASLSFHLDETASPFIGVAWDFEGNGRSRLYARAARQRRAPDARVRRRLAGVEDISVLDFTGSPVDTTNLRLSSLRPQAQLALDPELAPAATENLVIGLESELISDIAVGLAALWSRLEDEVVELSFDRGATIYLSHPGSCFTENPVTGAPLSSPQCLPPARRDSTVLSLYGRRRLSRGWQALLLVQWTRREGNLEPAPAASWVEVESGLEADFFSPEALTNAHGPLSDERRWRILASASYTWRDRLQLGAVAHYQSGAPVSRLGLLSGGRGPDERFVDGRGRAARSPSVAGLDLRLMIPWRLRRGELELWLELENLFDSQGALRVNERWSLLDEEAAAGLDPEAQRSELGWGSVLTRQEARRIELGLAYRW